MTDTAYIQRLIDNRTGIVFVPDGLYNITEPILVSDNTHLIASPGAHFRLADGANCPLLKNRNKPDGALTVNVTIEGGIWDGNNRNQTRALYAVDSIQPEKGVSLWFSGMSRFRLCHLTLKDPDAYGVLMTDVSYFTVEDIFMDCNKATYNEDGIHIDGYARHGRIVNIQGDANDDLVALNSDEGLPYSPDCTIEDITIDGVYGGDDGWTGVRLLSRDALVRNICIRNLYGKYKFNAVSFTHWAENPVDCGRFENIQIENIFATCCRSEGFGHGGLIWFQQNTRHIGRVNIRNYMRTEEAGLRNTVNLVDIGENVHIRSLILENIAQDIPDDKPPVVRGENAVVDSLTIDGKPVATETLPLRTHF